MIRRLAPPLAALLVAAASPAFAQSRGGETFPIPRYVSLRTDEANIRTGPGVQYPIEWVFTRRHMPVEVVEHFEYWRKIRDVEGTEGWVHTSMLSGKRYALVTGEIRSLRRKPEQGAPEAARLEPGVIGQILECQGQFCRLEAGGIKGWLARSEFWGVYPNETVK
jgi:SH3-like domain-containing protein